MSYCLVTPHVNHPHTRSFSSLPFPDKFIRVLFGFFKTQIWPRFDRPGEVTRQTYFICQVKRLGDLFYLPVTVKCRTYFICQGKRNCWTYSICQGQWIGRSNLAAWDSDLQINYPAWNSDLQINCPSRDRGLAELFLLPETGTWQQRSSNKSLPLLYRENSDLYTSWGPWPLVKASAHEAEGSRFNSWTDDDPEILEFLTFAFDSPQSSHFNSQHTQTALQHSQIALTWDSIIKNSNKNMRSHHNCRWSRMDT